MYASARKKSKCISQLRTDDGEVITDKERMGKIVMDYFQSIFTKARQGSVYDNERAEVCVTDEQNKALVTDIIFEEFTVAIK